MHSAVPSGFGGRAGSEVSVSHLFSQDVPTGTALVGGMAGISGPELVASVSEGFSQASW